MARNLVSKAEFARQVNVNASVVSRLCQGRLKAALVGKQINLAHAVTVNYLARNGPEPATGIDPMYEAAVEYCRAAGKWSANFFRSPLSIGSDKAKRIFETMKLNGVVPEKGAPTPEPPPPAPVKGMAKRNANKKAAAPPPEEPPEVPDNIGELANLTLHELMARFGTDVQFVDWLKATKLLEEISERRLKNAATMGTLVARTLVRTGIIDPFEEAFSKMLTDGSKRIATELETIFAVGESKLAAEEAISKTLSSFIRPAKAKAKRAMSRI